MIWSDSGIFRAEIQSAIRVHGSRDSHLFSHLALNSYGKIVRFVPVRSPLWKRCGVSAEVSAKNKYSTIVYNEYQSI